jgi:hypothetical protein
MGQGKKPKPPNSYLKYGSLAIQMAAIIAISAWAGMKIDEGLGLGFPAFMMLFILVAFTGMIYKLYLDNKDE